MPHEKSRCSEESSAAPSLRRVYSVWRGVGADLCVGPGADTQVRPYDDETNCGPYLGDIVIARGVARRQAREAGHSEGTELRVLALHGLLHLLGYDHERDKGRMRRVERRLLRQAGVHDGLIDRAPR